MDTLEDFLCLSDVLDYDKPSSSSDVQNSEYEQFEKELLALDLTNMDDPNVNKFINTFTEVTTDPMITATQLHITSTPIPLITTPVAELGTGYKIKITAQILRMNVMTVRHHIKQKIF